MSKVINFKEEGNRHFMSGDYAGAEGLYSKAIIAEPKNPALYTNRAMARIKMGLWPSVITDCQACLGLTPQNMKAHYYLSQAQLALGDFDDALTHALLAHELCVQSGDRSMATVTSQVLRCKRERWEGLERRRKREHAGLERELRGLLAAERNGELAVAVDDAERDAIWMESNAKLKALADVFECARQESDKRREVPDWAVDDISFGIMLDPVITKTGKSYERAAIMEHLRRHPSDPLTREPLQPADLRPNLGLRQACDEFLDKNGWAVDW